MVLNSLLERWLLDDHNRPKLVSLERTKQKKENTKTGRKELQANLAEAFRGEILWNSQSTETFSVIVH